MALVWFLKRWNKDVMQDSLVVLRIRGRRYLFLATRVEDPILVDTLKSKIDVKAQELMGARLASRA